MQEVLMMASSSVVSHAGTNPGTRTARNLHSVSCVFALYIYIYTYIHIYIYIYSIMYL